MTLPIGIDTLPIDRSAIIAKLDEWFLNLEKYRLAIAALQNPTPQLQEAIARELKIVEIKDGLQRINAELYRNEQNALTSAMFDMVDKIQGYQ